MDVTQKIWQGGRRLPPYVENCLPNLENLNKQMFLSESFYGTSAWWKSLNGVCTLIIFHYVRAQWNNVTCLHILILRGRKLPPLLYTFIFTYDLLRIFYLVLIEKLWKSIFVNHVNRLWQLTWFNLRYICSLKGYICLCTETCQKCSVTVIFCCVFHIKPHFFGI